MCVCVYIYIYISIFSPSAGLRRAPSVLQRPPECPVRPEPTNMIYIAPSV